VGGDVRKFRGLKGKKRKGRTGEKILSVPLNNAKVGEIRGKRKTLSLKGGEGDPKKKETPKLQP